MTAADKTAAFRALHKPGAPFVIANAWDEGSARMLQALGFSALATTSAGFALTLGRRDYRVTRREALDHAQRLAEAVDIPVSADLENGFGDAPEDAAATIRAAAEAGLAGGSIEDVTGDAQNPVYERAHAAERVAAAVEAARAAKNGFMLTARADGFLWGADDLDEIIARLQAFEAAGADALFAPGLPDLDALKTVCAAVSKPVNVLPIGGLARATLADFAAAGAARVSLGSSLANFTYQAGVQAARAIQHEGRFDQLAGDAEAAKILREALS